MHKLNIFKEQMKNFMAKYPAVEWNSTVSRIGEIGNYGIFRRMIIGDIKKENSLTKLKRIFI